MSVFTSNSDYITFQHDKMANRVELYLLEVISHKELEAQYIDYCKRMEFFNTYE